MSSRFSEHGTALARHWHWEPYVNVGIWNKPMFRNMGGAPFTCQQAVGGGRWVCPHHHQCFSFRILETQLKNLGTFFESPIPRPALGVHESEGGRGRGRETGAEFLGEGGKSVGLITATNRWHNSRPLS